MSLLSFVRCSEFAGTRLDFVIDSFRFYLVIEKMSERMIEIKRMKQMYVIKEIIRERVGALPLCYSLIRENERENKRENGRENGGDNGENGRENENESESKYLLVSKPTSQRLIRPARRKGRRVVARAHRRVSFV